MGELYQPYPKLPKHIRQIGERDQIVKLYVEDYVNTYLKRLYPSGGQSLRVGLLLGTARTEEGVPYLFVDGALEMDGASEGQQARLTEETWKRAYQAMEQMFPRRDVLGWFLCGPPGCMLSPLNYWKQHGAYFSGKNQLMYLNSGLEGEEAVYTASEEGFYKLRGYCIYYEKNQMMQDYMVSRKEAHRVESGARDAVIQDFRQKMEENRAEAGKRRSATHMLGTVCGVLTVVVLAGGVVMFNNYQKLKAMETVIASALPDGTGTGWSKILSQEGSGEDRDGVQVEQVPGQVYPTQADIRIETSGAEEPFVSGNQAASSQILPAQEEEPAPGQESVPESGDEASSHGQLSSAASIPSNAVVYAVKNGETLYGICMSQYGSMANLDTICQWNHLEDGGHIFAGQQLYIPAP